MIKVSNPIRYSLPNFLGGVNRLSKFRRELMGFAIMIIVFYHFCNRGGTTIIDKLFRIVFSHGYVGVDFFMVLSGLGLTFSFSQNSNLKVFYIKRWVRIFPFFTFITLIECWIIRGEDLGLSLLRSTTLGYWFGFPHIDWYVPAIVGLYVVFPIIYYWVVKPKRYLTALSIGMICLLVAIYMSKYDLVDWQHLCFVYRIPDFLMGCMAAIAIKNGYDERIVKRYVILAAIVGIIIFVMKIGGSHYIWFTNMCLTPLYMCLLCCMFEKCAKINARFLIVPFSFVGLFTLELYRISSSFERLLTNEACPEYHYMYVLLYVVASIALSYLAYLLFKRINTKILEKLLKIII